jgi:hypothetical protein
MNCPKCDGTLVFQRIYRGTETRAVTSLAAEPDADGMYAVTVADEPDSDEYSDVEQETIYCETPGCDFELDNLEVN